MALVNAYCAVEDVRGQLEDTSTKLDAGLLERAISATSRAIDRYCGRRFWQDPAPVPRVFEVTDPCLADVADISTTTGLVVAIDNAGDGSYATTWDSAGYRLRPLNADADGGAYAWRQVAAVGGNRFPLRRGYPVLQVTAQWGWSQVPDEVVQAAVLKATSLFKRKDAPFGVAGFGDFGAVRITRTDPDVADLLAPYVLSAVA